jgi:hypothetical protein
VSPGICDETSAAFNARYGKVKASQGMSIAGHRRQLAQPRESHQSFFRRFKIRLSDEQGKGCRELKIGAGPFR